jgi:hypothetical protein
VFEGRKCVSDSQDQKLKEGIVDDLA